MNTLWDPVRKLWVKATPEEMVRQNLIDVMVKKLGYPLSLLAIETEISALPHLALHAKAIPERRLDVVCFSKDIHPPFELFPLLLIECKAHDLTDNAVRQVMGYNHYIGACFIALCNMKEIRVGWYDDAKRDYSFVDHLPTFARLREAINLRG